MQACVVKIYNKNNLYYNAIPDEYKKKINNIFSAIPFNNIYICISNINNHIHTKNKFSFAIL